MKIRASEEQVKNIIVNAVLASSPVGMGFLHFSAELTREDIIKNLHSYDVDYFQGRMVKLYIKEIEDGWRVLTNIAPNIEYQSWCGKYKTYESLIKSVEGVEIYDYE